MPRRSEFADSLRTGVLAGAAVLVLLLPPVGSRPPATLRTAAVAPVPAVPPPGPGTAAPAQPAVAQLPVPQPTAPQAALRLADFAGQKPSADARRMADWVLQAGDNKDLSFVIVDKKDAKVYVFNPLGRLKAAAPALLGSAHGDDSFPGIGDKPLSQVLPEEKTTPAGRFIAELGMNTKGEDIVWVDYDAAVSMHRVRPAVKAERRLERLASPTPADNRISFGCINLPPDFYENVLRSTVQAGTTVIYVLPDTRPLREVFAGFGHRPAGVALARR